MEGGGATNDFLYKYLFSTAVHFHKERIIEKYRLWRICTSYCRRWQVLCRDIIRLSSVRVQCTLSDTSMDTDSMFPKDCLMDFNDFENAGLRNGAFQLDITKGVRTF
jgi:hypothetical protein